MASTYEQYADDPTFALLGDIIGEARARPPIPGYNSLSLAIQNDLHPAYRGDADPPGRVFLTPSFAFMALVALFPVLYAVVMSLHEIRGFPQEFTGTDNYVTALRAAGFWNAVRNTFVFSVTSVAIEFVIGMVFALIMNQPFPGRGVTRALILVPWGDPDRGGVPGVAVHVRPESRLRELGPQRRHQVAA